jgi:hypothetical protein
VCRLDEVAPPCLPNDNLRVSREPVHNLQSDMAMLEWENGGMHQRSIHEKKVQQERIMPSENTGNPTHHLPTRMPPPWIDQNHEETKFILNGIEEGAEGKDMRDMRRQ